MNDERIEKDRAYETTLHQAALRSFRGEVDKRYTNLKVELGIMALSGAVEVVA